MERSPAPELATLPLLEDFDEDDVGVLRFLQSKPSPGASW
jgi:hypothetical protein